MPLGTVAIGDRDDDNRTLSLNPDGGLTGAYGGELVTITRPSNTAAYSDGDIVGDGAGTAPIEFANMGPAGGRVMITSAMLMLYIGAVPSGMTSFTLALYDAEPPSAFSDGDPWSIPAPDRGNYLGTLSLGTPAQEGVTLACEQDGINKQVKLADGVTSLWGYLITDTGFTPSSADVAALRLHSVAL